MIQNIKFTYFKQPLNRYTFKAPKIKAWIEEQCRGKRVLNLFAGKIRLDGCNEITNDLDSSIITDHKMDALNCLVWLRARWEKFDVVILDPPYAYRKVMEKYIVAKDNVAVNEVKQNSRFKKVLDMVPYVLAEGGKVITFGYHSRVMSGKRGFETVEVLLVSHGGAQHDTIAAVEKRINPKMINYLY